MGVEKGHGMASQAPAPRVTARHGIAAGALAALLAVAAFVAPWEGRELAPYRDIVGVWTVCYGHTGNVERRTYTPAECDALLRSDAAVALVGVSRCVALPLTEGQWVAIGSWTFNVGVSAACRSTLMRKLNAGMPASVWCKELLRWDRAGGRKVRGLTKRREAEYRECIR
jgi:lysozyme